MYIFNNPGHALCPVPRSKYSKAALAHIADAAKETAASTTAKSATKHSDKLASTGTGRPSRQTAAKGAYSIQAEKKETAAEKEKAEKTKAAESGSKRPRDELPAAARMTRAAAADLKSAAAAAADEKAGEAAAAASKPATAKQRILKKKKT